VGPGPGVADADGGAATVAGVSLVEALAAALRGVALGGQSGPAELVEFCDEGWTCEHPECVAARAALARAEA